MTDSDWSPATFRDGASAIATDALLVGLSAIPIAGPLIAGVLGVGVNAERRNAERYRDEVLSTLQREVADLREAIALLRADTDRARLFLRGTRLAAGADGGQIVDLLARIVADASLPDTDFVRIQHANLMVEAVAQLHPGHITILRFVAQYSELNTAQIADRLPGLKPVMDPIIARVESLGLITDGRAPTNGFTGGSGGGPAAWVLTNFGSNILSYLNDESEEH